MPCVFLDEHDPDADADDTSAVVCPRCAAFERALSAIGGRTRQRCAKCRQTRIGGRKCPNCGSPYWYPVFPRVRAIYGPSGFLRGHEIVEE